MAGPISFGLNAGLAVVAGQLLNWDPSQLPPITLIAWGAAILVAAATLKVGWPILHTSTAGLLLVAASFATSTVVWPLPLAGAAAALALARFASVGMASALLSRVVGVVALAMVAYAGYLYATGDLALGGDATGGLEAVAGAGALLVIAALGLWHPGSDEDEE